MAQNTAQLKQLAILAARRAGISPRVFLRQIDTESGFQPGVTSPAGAEGIAQFMPGTARSEGVNPWNPRSALFGAARLDAKLINQTGSYRNALAAYNAGPGNIPAGLGYADKILAGQSVSGAARPGASGPTSTTRTIPGVDRTNQRVSILLNYLANESEHDTQSTGLLGAIQQISQTRDTPARTVTIPGAAPQGIGSAPKGGGGIGTFDGKPVQGWIVPILARARAAGWKGTVTSGVRTRQQQLAAAQRFGLQHYGPGGPLGSNHLAGRGAVDVTNPDQLDAVLKRLGISKLKRAMADDPVHFSATGH